MQSVGKTVSKIGFDNVGFVLDGWLGHHSYINLGYWIVPIVPTYPLQELCSRVQEES